MRSVCGRRRFEGGSAASPVAPVNRAPLSGGSSASSWTVSFSDLPAGDHIVNLAADTSATLNANPTTCSTCAGGASSNATIEFTFDLTAPIHVSAFFVDGTGLFHPFNIGM